MAKILCSMLPKQLQVALLKLWRYGFIKEFPAEKF